MNSALPHEFSRLGRPVQDLRPEYEAALIDVLRILWNRRVLIALVVLGVIALGLGGALLMKKTYVSEALIQLSFEADRTGTPSGGAPNVAVDAAAMVEGEAEIIRSRTIAQRVLERLDRVEASGPTPSGGVNASPATQADADRRILALQKGLSVRNDGKSYLIHVAYAADDPVRAAIVADAFAEEYLQSRIEVSYNSARRTGEWLAAQVTQAGSVLRAAEERARTFRAGPGAFATGTDGPRGDQQLSDLISQVSAARFERLRLEARLQRLRDAVAANRTPSATDLQGSTDAQQLIDAEIAARREVSRVESTLGVRHPLYGQAEKTLATARSQLSQAVTGAIGIAQMDAESAAVSEKNLNDQLARARQTSVEREEAGKEMARLEAEASAARANLDRLSESHRQALALADLKPIMAQMVSAATPLSVPASPRMSLVLVLSGIGGGMASLALVFLLHLRDVGFTTGAQVRAMLGTSCAGMIPEVRKRDRAAGLRVRERAVKALAVACGLTRPRPSGTVVVVTSSIAGEGKTDLVRALATTLASLNRRVMIVENAGRRAGEGRPDRAGAGEATGRHLVDTLSREGAGGTVALYHRSTDELADVFCSHDRMEEWLDENRSRFDVVIVEAPAILVDAEAAVVARAAHLVLFAAAWHATPKKAVVAAFSQLVPVPGQETAVVLTRVDLRQHRKIGQRDGLHFLRRYADAGQARA